MSKELEVTEFLKHYTDTYIRLKLKKGGEWIPAYFYGGEYQNSKSTPVYFSKDGRNKEAADLNAIEIDTNYPEFGLYPSKIHGSCILLVAKNGFRQWKWGLCRGNTSLTNVFHTSKLLKATSDYLINNFRYALNSQVVRLDSLALDHELAKEILNPAYVEYEKAIEELRSSKRLFACLDKDYFLMLSPSNKGMLLWRWDVPVAKISFPAKGSRVEVESIHKLFNQEVVDFFNRKAITDVSIKHK